MNADAEVQVLKVEFKGEIHRVSTGLNELSFEALNRLMQSSFSLESGKYVIQYYNDKKERFVISDEDSFQNCLGMHESGSIRFIAQTKNAATLHDATEPLLKAIEKLLKKLNLAMQNVAKKIKEDDWEGKCRRGFNATGEALRKAADETRDSLNVCKTKVQQYPYHDLMQETTESIKLAAQEISSFAKDLAHQIRNEYQPNATAPQTFTSPVVVMDPVMEEPVFVETEHPSVEEEWDVVANSNETAAEKYWESQLKVVRDVFPEADSDIVIPLLEKNSGDVIIVVNQLAEH